MKNKIKYLLVLLVIFSFSQVQAAPKKRIAASSDEAPLPLGVTHILPSALVIPGGTIVLGTSAGIGLFDVIDFSTNLYLDFQGVFNVSSKINIFSNPDYAMGIFGTYTTQNVKTNQYDANGNFIGQQTATSTSVAPGAVFSYRITPGFIGHIGGTIVFRNPSIAKGSTVPKRTALVQGSTLNKEFSFALGNRLAFSTGASYDTTYDIWGVGGSFHIGGFQLGVHYYLNVDEGALLPILGGGYVGSF